MYVLGLDIGYSNLKLTFGDASQETPTSKILPAGSAPETNVSKSIFSGGVEGGTRVTVGDKVFVAGITQSALTGWTRMLSLDYPLSDDYLALFYAALLETGRDEIDLVVTGLPVQQSSNREFLQQLENRLRGKHKVTDKKAVTVHDVKVIPQPVGAYVDYLMNCEDPDVVRESRVLVVDPGFFSVDWIAIDKGNFDQASSDSSQEAMSALLEEAAKLIEDDHNRPQDLATLEHAVRTTGKVPALGKMVEIAPYLGWAAGPVAESVMRKVRQKLRRSEVAGADFTLLAGGGAEFYREAAATIMSGTKVVTTQDPVLANSRGFFEYGRA